MGTDFLIRASIAGLDQEPAIAADHGGRRCQRELGQDIRRPLVDAVPNRVPKFGRLLFPVVHIRFPIPTFPDSPSSLWELRASSSGAAVLILRKQTPRGWPFDSQSYG